MIGLGFLHARRFLPVTRRARAAKLAAARSRLATIADAIRELSSGDIAAGRVAALVRLIGW